MPDSTFPTTDPAFNQSFHVWTDASRSRYDLRYFNTETIVDILFRVNRDKLRHLARLLGVKRGRNSLDTARNIARAIKDDPRKGDEFSRGMLSISIIPTVVD